ncbi:MAG: HEAT repeat domain-containing protein, partial [Methanothrix sp.]
MTHKILIAHAEGEEAIAESIAEPLRNAGYEVAHQGTVLVGESIEEEASKVLELGGPVVLCATVNAIGTGMPNRLVRAAQIQDRKRVFVIQIEKGAYIEGIAAGEKITRYWQDRNRALRELLAARNHYYPLDQVQERVQRIDGAEERYRNLLLKTCDIVNLANLPVQDPNFAQNTLKLRSLFVPLHAWIDYEQEADEIGWPNIEIESKMRLNARSGIHVEETGSRRKRVTIGERLINSRRLAVLGDPGSGKTTLVRWISTAYLLRLEGAPSWQDFPDIKTLQDMDLMPIIVKCRNFESNFSEWTLKDIFRFTLRKLELNDNDVDVLTQTLLDRMHEGTVFLMIDGLDEITDLRLRSSFCQQLEQISIAYPNAFMLVTSRIVGYRELGQRLGSSFDHIILADLSPEEKDDFANSWCDLTENPERRAEAERELIRGIHSNDRIERITGNPLLLTTMALVKRNVGKLPSRRADLYWEAVHVMLNWRSDVGEALDQHEAIPQLEYLAYAMCDLGVQQMRQDDVLEYFDKMREEYPKIHQVRKHSSEDFLHLIEIRTSLLFVAGYTRHLGKHLPIYEFRHQTFQEYLAALALVNGHFPERDKSKSLAEVIAQLTSRTEGSLGQNTISRNNREESWSEVIRLCATICNDDDVDKVILAILNPRKDEGDDAIRNRAFLSSLCIADEPNVEEEIVKKVFKILIGLLRADDVILGSNADVVVRMMIGTHWAELLHQSLILEFCQCDPDERWILGSFSGLIGAANAPQEKNALQIWLTTQEKEISNYTEFDAIDISLTLVQLSKENRVFGAAQLAKVILERLDSIAPLSHTSAWALRCFVGEYNRWRREWEPNSIEIQRIFAFVEKSNSDPNAIANLIILLGKQNYGPAFEILLHKLRDPNIHIRRATIKALGDMKRKVAAKHLVTLLQDSDAGVRRNVAFALGHIKSEDAANSLIALLQDSDASVRRAAIIALSNMKCKDVIDPFIALLGDSDAKVRRRAALSLCAIKSDKGLITLLQNHDEYDEYVLKKAAWALGEIKSEKAVDSLISLLKDHDAGVRKQAARALGEIKIEKAADSLISLLKDHDEGVRKNVAGALGEIKIEKAAD